MAGPIKLISKQYANLTRMIQPFVALVTIASGRKAKISILTNEIEFLQ